MSTPGDPPAVLAEALAALRSTVAGTSYPLALPDAAEAGGVRDFLVTQLDDYLVPRLTQPDAPLLAVVGGSTGAGKSTLVNSLAQAPVSPVGVLRPTTRAPVLVSHPGDTPWFRRPHVLPGLVRTNQPARDPGSVQLVTAHALTPGLALLDSPDIDSVVDDNRALASKLLAAADLWLFVTSAARYADAVHWELLHTARERGTPVALVLNRVAPEVADEVSRHLAELLTTHGFGDLPLFVVPETAVAGQGLLPEPAITQLRTWLGELARDAAARATVARQATAGAVAAATGLVDGLAAAADDQASTVRALADRARAAYRVAFSAVDEGIRDGALLRGEVLDRWQEYVGTGELFGALLTRIGRLRDQMGTIVTGRPKGGRALKTAIRSSVATLVRAAATEAAEQAAAAWRVDPAGAHLLAASQPGEPGDLGRPSDDLDWRIERLVREWQREVLRLVGAQAGGKRAGARLAAYAVNAGGLLVMMGVCASAPRLPAGPEAGGDDTTAPAQQVLAAVFGDEAIRDLAARAREDLLARVRALFDHEERRYLDRIAAVGVEAQAAGRLHAAAAAVRRAAAAAGLTAPVPADRPVTADGPATADGPVPAGSARARAVAARGTAEPHVPEPRQVPPQETARRADEALVRPGQRRSRGRRS